MISSYSTTFPYIKVGLPHPLKTIVSSCLLLSIMPSQCSNIVEKVEILYLFIYFAAIIEEMPVFSYTAH